MQVATTATTENAGAAITARQCPTRPWIRGLSPRASFCLRWAKKLMLTQMFEQLLRFDLKCDPSAATPVAAAQRWVAVTARLAGDGGVVRDMASSLIPTFNALQPHCLAGLLLRRPFYNHATVPTWEYVKALVTAFIALNAGFVFPGELAD